MTPRTRAPATPLCSKTGQEVGAPRMNPTIAPDKPTGTIAGYSRCSLCIYLCRELRSPVARTRRTLCTTRRSAGDWPTGYGSPVQYPAHRPDSRIGSKIPTAHSSGRIGRQNRPGVPRPRRRRRQNTHSRQRRRNNANASPSNPSPLAGHGSADRLLPRS